MADWKPHRSGDRIGVLALVPIALKGGIIGPAGSRVAQVRSDTGASVLIEHDDPNRPFMSIVISGTRRQVDTARASMDANIARYGGAQGIKALASAAGASHASAPAAAHSSSSSSNDAWGVPPVHITRPGDWTCASCKYFNWADKKTCKNCNRRAPESASAAASCAVVGACMGSGSGAGRRTHKVTAVCESPTATSTA
jgi:hypothetical protein